MARKGYPAEFRRRALDLVAAGKPVADVDLYTSMSSIVSSRTISTEAMYLTYLGERPCLGDTNARIPKQPHDDAVVVRAFHF